MMMRMTASLFSSRSCGRLPLIVTVEAAVIASLGSFRVGRPGSSDGGGGVGDADRLRAGGAVAAGIGSAKGAANNFIATGVSNLVGSHNG